MPGFDRTGPMGLGPRTGGGFGLCGPGAGWRTASGVRGRLWRGAGRGLPPWGGGRGRVWRGGRGSGYWGRGGGFGRGRGAGSRVGARPWPGYGAVPRGWPANEAAPYGTRAQSDELEFLRDQASYLEQEMKSIKERIKELEAKE